MKLLVDANMKQHHLTNVTTYYNIL